MSLSRLHRPKRFADVTGQRHITDTLRQEVASGILGHAFLFSGPRGVGKTTTARIFAKALLNPDTDHGEPPADSPASIEIDQGSCIDCIEIDAASHTGVDNVREAIIEHVRFAPAKWKRKVYILDECHMLSPSAWNAMLKTLEEPPEYAFFILATTELHKVPETIKSRCQRFEFRRISNTDLVQRLKELSEKERISISDESIRRIVHASDGCVRDAESLLDQLSSLGEGNVTKEIVELMLPISRIPEAAVLVRTCATQQTGEALAQARTLIDSGMNVSHLIDDLITVIRRILTMTDPHIRAQLTEGDEGDRAILQLDGLLQNDQLLPMALMLMDRRKDLKYGNDPQFILELAIVSLCQTFNQTTRSVQPSENLRDSHQQQDSQIETNHQKKAETKTNSTSSSSPPITSTDKPTTEVVVSEGRSYDIHDIRKHWNNIITEVEKENRSIPFILKVCTPSHIDGSTIHLRFQYRFHREKLIEDLKTKRVVERAMRAVMHDDAILIDGTCSEEQEGENRTSIPQDIVSRVLSTFGGNVVD